VKNISPDWILIIEKYLSGEATEEERNAIDAWYSSFDELPGYTDGMSQTELKKAMNSSLNKIQNRLD